MELLELLEARASQYPIEAAVVCVQDLQHNMFGPATEDLVLGAIDIASSHLVPFLAPEFLDLAITALGAPFRQVHLLAFLHSFFLREALFE